MTDETNKQGTAGDSSPDKTSDKVQSRAEDKEVFGKEYVQILRDENKESRTKLADAQKVIKEKEDALIAKQKEFETTLSAKAQAANERIIRSELKAHAVAAGIVDLDGLKLIDTKDIKVDENGEVVGAEEAIKALKEKKTYLFVEHKSSTYTGKGAEPEKKAAKKGGKNAFDLPPEEFKKNVSTRAWRVIN